MASYLDRGLDEENEGDSCSSEEMKNAFLMVSCCFMVFILLVVSMLCLLFDKSGSLIKKNL